MHRAGLAHPPHPEEEKKENRGRSRHSEQQEQEPGGMPERSAKLCKGCPTQRSPPHTNLPPGSLWERNTILHQDIQAAKRTD